MPLDSSTCLTFDIFSCPLKSEGKQPCFRVVSTLPKKEMKRSRDVELCVCDTIVVVAKMRGRIRGEAIISTHTIPSYMTFWLF